MAEAEQKVLFIGLGDFEGALLARIAEHWKVIVMDLNDSSLQDYRKKFPDIETISGDASSIMTLRKVDFGSVAHVICSIRDLEVVGEICHMLRHLIKVEVPILIVHYEPVGSDRFAELNLNFFNPIELGSRSILNRMEKNLIRPTSIGQGLGEIIEVTIRSASHLTGRRLKYMRPTNWHVSMIYRKNEPLIPTGDIRLKVGDRVVLAGNPKVLENIAQLLITGTPQFPIQYGRKMLYPLEAHKESCLMEASFWLRETNLEKIQYMPYHQNMTEDMLKGLHQFSEDFEYGKGIGLFNDLFELQGDYGMMFLELKTFFKNARIRTCFKHAKIPVLISRSSFPYQRVLVSLNCHQPTMALETGVEISRLTGVPLEVCYVALPEEMQHEREKELIEERLSIIRDFKSIFKMDFPYHVKQGNPVHETLAVLESDPFSLMIVVADPLISTRIFNTNVPYLISKKSKASTLVIPGDVTHG